MMKRETLHCQLLLVLIVVAGPLGAKLYALEATSELASISDESPVNDEVIVEEEAIAEETAEEFFSSEEAVNTEATQESSPEEESDANEGAASTEVDTPPAVPQPIELSEEMQTLRYRVRECLDFYYEKRQNTQDDHPWNIMHSVIAYGVDTQVHVRHRNGPRVSAIGWLCYNEQCEDERLFYLDEEGRLFARQGYKVQGHHGQLLAILAQSKVASSYPIKIEGKDFSVADLIEFEQRTCRPNSELTFKLIGLSHYIDTDSEWEDDKGTTWNFERLLKEELAQPIQGAACGGTHRMMGFSFAVAKRLKEGKPLTGQWARASKYVKDYHRYALTLQNSDGSFSTSFFEGRADTRKREDRLESTGHIIEWLASSLSDKDLHHPNVVAAVNNLTEMLISQRYRTWKVGPLGHGLHGLAVYDQRVFGTKPGHRLAAHRAEIAAQRAAANSTSVASVTPATPQSPVAPAADATPTSEAAAVTNPDGPIGDSTTSATIAEPPAVDTGRVIIGGTDDSGPAADQEVVVASEQGVSVSEEAFGVEPEQVTEVAPKQETIATPVTSSEARATLPKRDFAVEAAKLMYVRKRPNFAR